MNKLFTKIAGAVLGLTLTIGVGLGAGSSKEAMPVHAVEGTELAVLSGTGSSYATRKTTTDVHGVDWVLRTGQSGYLGVNNASNHNKVNPTEDDLPVVKAVVSEATTSSTGIYYYFTTTAVSNVGSLTFQTTAHNNASNAAPLGYVVYSSTAASSGSATWEQVPLSASSKSAQGSSISGTSLYTFTFASTQTSPKYYGFVSTLSAYDRWTAGTIKLIEGTTSTPAISVDATSSVKVGSTVTLGVTYANLASGVTISATCNDTSVATVTSSVTTTAASGTANFTLTGKAEGTATISFSASYSGQSLSCSSNVSAYLEYNFQKITKVAELNTSKESGGKYVIAYSGDSTTVMSNTQNSNNRGKTTAVIESDVMTVPGSSSIAILNILKDGDFYTIYDAAKSGYLYGASGNNYLRTSNPATKNNFYYWSITFSDGNAVITNKGSGYVIRYNSNSSIFSTYNGTQNAIELWELDSDIPAYVKLTSLTASNNSVQVGSTLTYTASYLPVNASEGITVTSNNDSVATVESSGMSSGTLTVEIAGHAVGSTTLSFVGEDVSTAINTSVTITVTAYTATHTLVTSSSSLPNGAKVIIGCTVEGFDFSAEKSSGGNNLSAAATGFAADKSTLAKAELSQEFTVWSVDEYYVFSDGGYFLTAPNSKNNYLQRTDVLSEKCYFTISNDSEGVVVTSNYASAQEWGTYTIQFNSDTSKFSLYATSQKATSLYLSNAAINPIQGFVDSFMHMLTYTSNSGYCADENHHYYSDAKTAYTSLTSAQKQTFCTDSAYADAYARLSAWANANGDVLDSDLNLVSKSRTSLTALTENNNIAILIIVIASSMTLIAGVIVFKRKKNQLSK
ncbi:MAG: hypothetical protein IKB70_12920 [Bacilli bacterium]|nr:hypothetical protein [Bacilli bacterium]